MQPGQAHVALARPLPYGPLSYKYSLRRRKIKGVYDLEASKNVVLQNPGSLHFSAEFHFEPQILIRIFRQPSSVADLAAKIEDFSTIALIFKNSLVIIFPAGENVGKC